MHSDSNPWLIRFLQAYLVRELPAHGFGGQKHKRGPVRGLLHPMPIEHSAAPSRRGGLAEGRDEGRLQREPRRVTSSIGQWVRVGRRMETGRKVQREIAPTPSPSP